MCIQFKPSDSIDIRIKRNIVELLHRITFISGFLIVAYCSLMCLLSFWGSLDDMQKFKGLGFDYSFTYYLNKNSFPDSTWKFLLVFIEFMSYTKYYHRARRKKRDYGGAWIFTAIFVVHIILLLHTINLTIPTTPPYISTDGIKRSLLLFIRGTAIQSTLYILSFTIHLILSPWLEG